MIRREFDIGEGDAYNRALINRAERRLKNLNFFKSVKITDEPGSAPDRLIVNVDVEEQSTGEFSFSGGYSTADGVIGEVSVGERNLLGRGQSVRAAVQYGSITRGINLSFVEPYFLGNRLALALEVRSAKRTHSNRSYQVFGTRTIGGSIRLGIPLTDAINLQTKYSAYTQKITLPDVYNNCNNNPPDNINALPLNPTPGWHADGEASPAIRKELAQGEVFVSLVGYERTARLPPPPHA